MVSVKCCLKINFVSRISPRCRTYGRHGGGWPSIVIIAGRGLSLHENRTDLVGGAIDETTPLFGQRIFVDGGIGTQQRFLPGTPASSRENGKALYGKVLPERWVGINAIRSGLMPNLLIMHNNLPCHTESNACE